MSMTVLLRLLGGAVVGVVLGSTLTPPAMAVSSDVHANVSVADLVWQSTSADRYPTRRMRTFIDRLPADSAADGIASRAVEEASTPLATSLDQSTDAAPAEKPVGKVREDIDKAGLWRLLAPVLGGGLLILLAVLLLVVRLVRQSPERSSAPAPADSTEGSRAGGTTGQQSGARAASLDATARTSEPTSDGECYTDE